ncbi:hypothetical protein I305_05512 [Cryptococcus gattii E566]|uniref:Uncharacterized protein n=2 Tax=Cryptococcus gattii TaxID=37769 RepID=E6R8T0_CRYGW|nr:Hypothetical Protein CGB_G0050C [Cryptococcus gattii WM276]ADV23298.1 Hypothetical Protein CGB_G0050C [Cryptococcus gattii WM276]KIR77962.1 hypothetical protein I306_05029 [Cryptococcus gattii EJB2]KIY31880.1 hypothetical protein I305_05512 [Cryptococcus gattii E566]KJD99672.1 hypothetical protein I311_06743 [Cryptococcus gattii NT-10]
MASLFYCTPISISLPFSQQQPPQSPQRVMNNISDIHDISDASIVKDAKNANNVNNNGSSSSSIKWNTKSSGDINVVITFTRTLPSYRRTYRRFLLILLSDQLPTTFIAWLIRIIGVIVIAIRMWNYLPNTRNTVQV